MTATLTKGFEAKTFDHLKDLDGISQDQLDVHYKLYNGYVTNVNKLIDQIRGMISSGEMGTPVYNELKRRMGFELDGVLLHELYFNNMKPNGGELDPNSKFGKLVAEQFGSIENWKQDFINTGMMRGIGWAITYQCPCSGMLWNFWVTDHENGHPAGLTPVLVMDVWEHAYSVDHKPTDRKVYVDAFFKNINWQEVDSRLN